jgi:hypothetical protein
VPDVRKRDHDQQGRNPDGRENVKHFGPLFVDQNEDDRRQTQNPKVREASSSLWFVRLYSLTHNLSGGNKGKAGYSPAFSAADLTLPA